MAPIYLLNTVGLNQPETLTVTVLLVILLLHTSGWILILISCQNGALWWWIGLPEVEEYFYTMVYSSNGSIMLHIGTIKTTGWVVVSKSTLHDEAVVSWGDNQTLICNSINSADRWAKWWAARQYSKGSLITCWEKWDAAASALEITAWKHTCGEPHQGWPCTRRSPSCCHTGLK